MQTRIAVSSALLLGFCLPNTALAQVLDAVDRGWYDATGFHQPVNRNYICGECACTIPATYRNWFVFDLSEVTETISGATLVLRQPLGGYASFDPTETYSLFDVVTPIDALRDGTGGIAAYDDLGTGTGYGSQTVSEADEQTLVFISLNANAIAALNEADGLFAIAGAITTLSPQFNVEYTFGNSGTNSSTRMVLETAPAECFVVFGDGPGVSIFDPGMHAWSTYVDRLEDFYLVTMADIPEFTLPLRPDAISLDAGSATLIPDGQRGSSGGRSTSPSPAEPPAFAGDEDVPVWMRDGGFTVQVVMWSPETFPLLPEQVSHGLYVQILPGGLVQTVPYGAGTGMSVWAETDVDANGRPVIRFPFDVPGI